MRETAMAEYQKPWLSIPEQIERLDERGVDVGDREEASALLMEFGQLSRLYRGLINPLATRIAQSYQVPTKRLMASWTASLTYVRNVAAHHARLFKRKLVDTPKRPKTALIPVLDHLSQDNFAKSHFGVYNVLAVMAYLTRSIVTPDRP